jgi:membrane protein DedA with SNARE-associated domain
MSFSGLVHQFPYAGLFLLLILGGIGFPFPEDTTLILCGFLISHEIVEPIPALAVVYCGILMTDFSLYLVGKKYGRAVITHRSFRRILSREKLSRIEDEFKKRGTLVILFGRQLIGLRAQIFIVAGITRMSPLRFITLDGITALFTIGLMAGAGYVGGQSLQIITKDVKKLEYLAIFIFVIVLAIYLLFRYFKARKGINTG